MLLRGEEQFFFSPFFCPDFDSPVNWHSCFINCWQLKMQPRSLSKLLLIIFFLNSDPSVDCLRHSAGNGRPELFCGSEVYNIWPPKSDIQLQWRCGWTPHFLDNEGAEFSALEDFPLFTPQSLFAISLRQRLRQRRLPNTITRWLGRDKGRKNFDPLPSMDSVKKWPTV